LIGFYKGSAAAAPVDTTTPFLIAFYTSMTMAIAIFDDKNSFPASQTGVSGSADRIFISAI
jgi:hypothetical protein